LFLVGWKTLVPTPSANQIREALKFSQFRFKLIEFLKLPLGIDEAALREALERTSCGVSRNYLARAERVDEILKSEDFKRPRRPSSRPIEPATYRPRTDPQSTVFPAQPYRR
jgi:hypothetical protein